ncbi:MAG: multidrug effflux MFS transporter [Candidatus Delongbacteria bacterium]|nr:multidrug effflux MFS transporter [Candidatus Delongbacteria bacterium]
MRLSHGSIGLYLIMLTLLSRMANSLYLPAITRIGEEFFLSTRQLADTLTWYGIMFAAVSFFLGPLSDRLGRKRLMMVGIVFFLIGSWICALADGYFTFMLGRLLQAAGGSAIPILSRAIIRDSVDDHQVIGIIGMIGVVGSLAPVLAPIAGGFLTQSFGWRSTFHTLALSTLGVAAIVGYFAPETLSPSDRQPFSFFSMLTVYFKMLIDPYFIIVILPVILCFCIQGIYLVSAPFILMHLFGLSPVQFGLTSLFLIVGMIIGRYLCSYGMKRTSMFRIYRFGAWVIVVSGLIFVGMILTDHYGIMMLLVAGMVYCIGFGMQVPIGIKSVLTRYKSQAGAASSLYGTLTLGAGALGSALMGWQLTRTTQDISLLGLSIFILSLLIVLFSQVSRNYLK